VHEEVTVGLEPVSELSASMQVERVAQFTSSPHSGVSLLTHVVVEL